MGLVPVLLRAVVQIELYDWRRRRRPIQYRHVSVDERSDGEQIAPERQHGGRLARSAVKQRSRDSVKKVHIPDYEETTGTFEQSCHEVIRYPARRRSSLLGRHLRYGNGKGQQGRYQDGNSKPDCSHFSLSPLSLQAGL